MSDSGKTGRERKPGSRQEVMPGSGESIAYRSGWDTEVAGLIREEHDQMGERSGETRARIAAMGLGIRPAQQIGIHSGQLAPCTVEVG